MKTKSKLIVNTTEQEVRVAVVEDNRLSELYLERDESRGIVGNIYKGKVVRVLPGMQASFVDIGLERAAFLYVSDFFEEFSDAFDSREVEEAKRKTRNAPRIEDLVKEGQEVLVQIAKDPIGTKGARVTSHVSLPGRHLVYMPSVNHIGVSKKIDSEEERKRLKGIITEAKTTEGGFIIRTAAVGQDKKDLVADVEHLESQWEKILARHQGRKAPALVHEDLGLLERMVRDYFTDDIDEVIVDNRDAFAKINQFVSTSLPKMKKSKKIFLYKEDRPIFEHFNLEKQIDTSLGKKVWLKSGGYLIIDQTEALTSIDVNTGRFVGSKNLEETVLKTNLEAVDEIVNQLRLRNIGGLIILDIIDMEKRYNREKVYRKLEEVMSNDKAKTNVLKISELGLIEMTRKRTRENMIQTLCEPCVMCEGRGYHKSARTIAYAILRRLSFEISQRKTHENIELVVHPNVAIILKNEEYDFLLDLENKTGRRIVIREQSNFHVEHYQINFTGLAMGQPGVENLPMKEVKPEIKPKEPAKLITRATLSEQKPEEEEFPSFKHEVEVRSHDQEE